MRNLKDYLLSFLFPQRCVFCGQCIEPEREACFSCQEQVVQINRRAWLRAHNGGRPVSYTVPYLYAHPVRQAILRFKFSNRPYYAKFFAARIVESLQKNGLPAVTHVTCVPLSKSRQRKRGYNQSELLARQIARLLEKPYQTTLVKTQENQVQHTLPKDERLRNVQNVYQVCSADCVKGNGYLLIDDIITTGTTLLECAGTLRKAGARKVICAAIAKVDRAP